MLWLERIVTFLIPQLQLIWLHMAGRLPYLVTPIIYKDPVVAHLVFLQALPLILVFRETPAVVRLPLPCNLQLPIFMKLFLME